MTQGKSQIVSGTNVKVKVMKLSQFFDLFYKKNKKNEIFKTLKCCIF